MKYPTNPSYQMHPSTGKFTDGNPGLGIPPSLDSGEAYNQLWDELLYLITQAGVTPAEGTLTQVHQAVAALIAAALTGYSLTSHNHDASYSALGHNHDASYAAIGHNHNASYAAISHTHTLSQITDAGNVASRTVGVGAGNQVPDRDAADTRYSQTSHNHDASYAAIGHNHSGVYAPVSHTHTLSQITDAGNVASRTVGVGAGNQVPDRDAADSRYTRPNTGVTFSSVVSTTTFNATSDERKKTDIEVVKPGLTRLMQGIEFLWKGTQKKSSGVSAQQFQKNFSHLVDEDKEGNLSVNYNGIFAYVIADLNDLVERIEKLEAKIT